MGELEEVSDALVSDERARQLAGDIDSWRDALADAAAVRRVTATRWLIVGHVAGLDARRS